MLMSLLAYCVGMNVSLSFVKALDRLGFLAASLVAKTVAKIAALPRKQVQAIIRCCLLLCVSFSQIAGLLSNLVQ